MWAQAQLGLDRESTPRSKAQRWAMSPGGEGAPQGARPSTFEGKKGEVVGEDEVSEGLGERTLGPRAAGGDRSGGQLRCASRDGFAKLV